MPAQANANVVALQLEKVRDKVPLLYERDDILLTMIQQRGDVEKVSSRNMRLPLQVNPGGKAGSYNADGGDLGRGSGTQYDVAQVSPIFFRFAIEITKLVEYATTGRERAIENATKREVANGMKQFRAFLDKLMQTAGNGVLGTINSIASTTFTMAVPSGAALVYPGQTIQIYDTTLTTNRNVAAGVTTTVLSADPISAQTITVDNVPAGTVANDVIVHDGLTGAQPVSLFGIKYHQNSATTGTWLNLNRATYPVQLQTPRVNAGNAALTPSNVRLAINKVRKSLGINHVSKLIAYMAVEQEHAWENLGITISQIIKEGGASDGNDLDLLFSGRKTMSGVPIKSSVNADQTRVDFLDLSHWGRAVLKDIDFYEVNGNTVFPIYGASGGIAASYIFYFDTAFQVWDDSPRTGAFIDTLARPSGY
ncbi:MAG TPA: hypothetical protein VMI32_17165 [Candidatus Solibacter sp.]|nr:hypothetical protein [Candidatus Solibacter sp.]